MSIYTYHINLDERGEWSSDVRDTEGQTIFAIDTASRLDLIEDGFVKCVHDAVGILDYLVYLGIVDAGDSIETAY